MTKLKVAVVMGAESDLPVVKKAIDQLDALGVEREVRVLSAHRTPEEACKFAAGAKEAGFGVLICAAGKAAHLAGVMAGHTTLPVIGIPVKGSFLDGLDALLATIGKIRNFPFSFPRKIFHCPVPLHIVPKRRKPPFAPAYVLCFHNFRPDNLVR